MLFDSSSPHHHPLLNCSPKVRDGINNPSPTLAHLNSPTSPLLICKGRATGEGSYGGQLFYKYEQPHTTFKDRTSNHSPLPKSRTGLRGMAANTNKHPLLLQGKGAFGHRSGAHPLSRKGSHKGTREHAGSLGPTSLFTEQGRPSKNSGSNSSSPASGPEEGRDHCPRVGGSHHPPPPPPPPQTSRPSL